MLSFSLVAEALTGLIYHRPSAENSKFLPSFLLFNSLISVVDNSSFVIVAVDKHHPNLIILFSEVLLKCTKFLTMSDIKNFQARSHNEANEAVPSPKISKKNLPQMKNS